MKIREFIRESMEDQSQDFDNGPGGLEVVDGAEENGASMLATALENERNDPEYQSHEDPKVSATAVIEYMRLNGFPQFSDAILEKIKGVGSLKSIIRSIEPDNNGVKWVHLNKPETEAPENDDQQPGDAISAGPDEEAKQKTVGDMAKRAMDKRG
jgi:hypothetical protein